MNERIKSIANAATTLFLQQGYSYYADVKQDSNGIHVSEGGKPFLKGGFSRYVEVYFPKEYRGNLAVTTTDGDIDLSGVNLKLTSLCIDSTAGTVSLGSADTSVIHLSSTSGKIACEKPTETVNCTSTSGDIDVKTAVGSGSYKANNSGKLQISYAKVTGDLSFFNKNDGINLALPQDLEFEFEATTKNGSVSTSFQKYTSVDQRTTHGTIGDTPTVTVKTETNNGDIRVTQ